MPKVVVDTNVLLASIGRSSPYRWIFDRIISGEIALCVSNEILFEYREVLTRKASVDVAENILYFIDIHPSTVKINVYFNFGLISADADDNKFVDCAIATNADFILSNDKHFLTLREIDFPKVEVRTVADFEAETFTD